jgi:hypothetical protein
MNRGCRLHRRARITVKAVLRCIGVSLMWAGFAFGGFPAGVYLQLKPCDDGQGDPADSDGDAGAAGAQPLTPAEEAQWAALVAQLTYRN